MSTSPDVSPLTLNRLSVYLRCLRQLESEGVATISSKRLAERFELSSTLIRKDLAQFGEFGVRGVGYRVPLLVERLHQLLGLDTRHRLVIVGMGNLGTALAAYFGFNDASFRVAAALDVARDVVGRRVGSITVEDTARLEDVCSRERIDIGVIAVPADAAQAVLEDMAEAGIRSVLNFAPVLLKSPDEVRLKNVDMRIFLEEMAFFLQSQPPADG